MKYLIISISILIYIISLISLWLCIRNSYVNKYTVSNTDFVDILAVILPIVNSILVIGYFIGYLLFKTHIKFKFNSNKFFMIKDR